MMRRFPAVAMRKYDALFNKLGEGKSKDKYRIYLPLDDGQVKPSKVVPPQDIIDYLTSLKFTLNDYLLGTATMPDGKRIVRLGKVLAKKPELLKKFENDPQRKMVKHDNMWVVISRHPYDILGMSFDRGWTSCMNLEDGINAHYLEGDLKHGTIVAYLIKNSDKNINNPTSRIAIRPYFNESKQVYLVPSNVYGTDSAQFKKIVKKFCTMANSTAPHGRYELDSDLYDDGDGDAVFHLDAAAVRELSEDDAAELAMTQHLEPEMIDALLERDDSVIASGLVNRHLSSMSEETLLKIVANEDYYRAHASIARSGEKVPTSVLLALVRKNDNEDLLMYMAERSTNVEVLSALADSSIEEVRAGVAENSVATDKILSKLCDDTSVSVLQSVLKNENVATDIVKFIIIHNSSNEKLLKLALKRGTDTPMDFMLPYIEENLNSPHVCDYATDNPLLPPDMIVKIYQKTKQMHEADEWDGNEIMNNIAGHRKTPQNVLEELAASTYNVAGRIMRRPSGVTPEMVDAMLINNAHNVPIVMSVLDRSQVSLEHMQIILRSDETKILNYALKSGHMTEELYDYLIEKGDEYAVAKIACDLSPERDHAFMLRIAQIGRERRMLLGLADMNSDPLPEDVIDALMNNPASTISVFYALYIRCSDQGLFEKYKERFAPMRDRLEDYAAETRRYSLKETDERRENPMPVKRRR
jgi:hypothetical protein